MTEKHLTESSWKSFAKGADYKDAALLKALAALDKAGKAGPGAELEALDEIEKQADVLRKANKADKDLSGYLNDLDKALSKQRKASEQAAREQDASEDEDEESPALLTTKMAPLLKQIRKGDVVMKVMIASTGKDVAVLISRRDIAPTRSKLLKEYLGTSSGVKIILGECLLEEKAHTFVVQSQAAGLAKKLKAALQKQTEMKLKVRVRGEDPDDIDEEGEEDGEPTDGGATSEPPVPPPAPPLPDSPEALKARFDKALADLRPAIQAALEPPTALTPKVQALLRFAQDKAAAGDIKAAIEALVALRKAVNTVPTGTPGGEPSGGAKEQDPGAVFTNRLKALLPRLKSAEEQGLAVAKEVRAKAAEAGGKAKDKDFDSANRLLDEVEALLEDAATSPPVGTQDSPARALYESLRSRLEADYDALIEGPSIPALREQINTISNSWNMATELAGQGNFARANAILQRLADANALAKLLAAKNAAAGPASEGTPPGDEPRSGSLVDKRIFMLERWKRIPGELAQAVQGLARDIRDNEGDESPDELAAGIQDYLDQLLEETQNAMNDAVNQGDSSAFKGLAKRVEDDEMMTLLLRTSAVDGSGFRKAVLDAMQEIEDAMTA